MITITHGEDTVSSRQTLLNLKKDKNTRELDVKILTLGLLQQEFEGTSLFSEEKIIIIEHLLKNNPKDLIDYIKNVKTSYELILWEEGVIPKKTLESFPQAKIIYHPIKKTIFQFLDAIKPGSGKFLIKLFHETLKTSEAELVFHMLVRHFRLMMAILGNGKIDEVKRLQGWQEAKLKRQAGSFGIDRLKVLYAKLFQIDLEQKTGKSPLSLTAALDLFLLEI